MVAGALGALAFAPSSWPSPQAAAVVATSSMAAVASRTFRPGTDSRPIRFGYRIFLPAFSVGTSKASLRVSPTSCRIVQACCRLPRKPARGPESRARRDVLGFHAVEKSLGPVPYQAGRRACFWELQKCRMASIQRFSYTIRWRRQHPAAL
jgi:hypothetical protein